MTKLDDDDSGILLWLPASKLKPGESRADTPIPSSHLIPGARRSTDRIGERRSPSSAPVCVTQRPGQAPDDHPVWFVRKPEKSYAPFLYQEQMSVSMAISPKTPVLERYNTLVRFLNF